MNTIYSKGYIYYELTLSKATDYNKKFERAFAEVIKRRIEGTIKFHPNGKLIDGGNYATPKDDDEKFDIFSALERSRIKEFSKKIPLELQMSIKDNLFDQDLYNEIYNQDSVLSDLNATVDEKINDGLSYNVNGVSVSKNKIDKIWPKLRMQQLTSSNPEVKNCSLYDLLMHALTYKSIYTDDEIDALEIGLKSYNFGGRGGR